MGSTEKHDENWERKVLERLALESLAEQRRRRRWGIFFKLMGFGYLAVVLYLVGGWGDSQDVSADGKGYTALVSVEGVIEAGGEASADEIIGALQDAFADDAVRGVILRVNSPGGSPVQAGMINDEVARLRAQHPEVKVAAVVEDVCASGGYYIAVAADRIFVDKASLVGSIGVLMDSFGFVGTMDKIGIERRLLSAGTSKGFLDPFSPQRTEDVSHARVLLSDIHEQFIDVVRKGRGDRLKESPELFSGLVWTGRRSIELGLADEFGTVDSVARNYFQTEEVRDFTRQQGVAERLAERFGANMVESALSAFSRVSLR